MLAMGLTDDETVQHLFDKSATPLIELCFFLHTRHTSHRSAADTSGDTSAVLLAQIHQVRRVRPPVW